MKACNAILWAVVLLGQTSCAPFAVDVADGRAGSPLSSKEIRVRAVGYVVHPGDYRLPKGTSILDLVQAAGGIKPSGTVQAPSSHIILWPTGERQKRQVIDRARWGRTVLHDGDVVEFPDLFF